MDLPILIFGFRDHRCNELKQDSHVSDKKSTSVDNWKPSPEGEGRFTWQDTLKQLQQDLGNLGSALQSGDLSGAQSAFSALLQSIPASSPTQTSQQSGATGVQADLNALGQALQSGDMNAAQTAYTKLQQDMQVAHGHHHHHHHAQAAGAQSATANSAADQLQTSGSSASNSSSDNGAINITG
jgi:hypothetical protein